MDSVEYGWEKIYEAIDKPDVSGLNIPPVNCSFNHRQLGYTDEWLKLSIMQSESNGDADEIRDT